MKQYEPCTCLTAAKQPKRRHATRSIAKSNAKMLGRRYDIHYRVYKCPGGMFWHITSDGEYERRNNASEVAE